MPPVGRYHLFGVAPLPVVIVAVIALVFWFLMERTRWGRVFYAVGGNETAAYLAGDRSGPTGSPPMSFPASLRR